jgi:hypothetical protein
LRDFENRVPRGIFGPKTEEVTGGWRRLHNEKLDNSCSSPYIIRAIRIRMGWVGHIACMREIRNSYRILKDLREETTWETQVQIGG